MAMRWLSSLVCLMASVAAAQDYSGGDLLDATITKSITETVTQYLSQCGVTPSSHISVETTIIGTTTITSTLKSTITVVLPDSATNTSATSSTAPVGLTTSHSTVISSQSSYSPSPPHTYTTSSGGLCPGFNCTISIANATTKIPCPTSTVVVTPHPLTSSTLTLSTTSSGHSATPVHATSSVAATNGSPSQIPVSGSAKSKDIMASQGFLGALSLIFMIVAGFL
ncbi:hypothetical protein GGR54DRAFT_200931 [Hypoxylon sp. NC1633]|nr:hypothetical protein GGR54DRAFT_200931 [Hypoxylon sp. NC1633]